MFLQGRFTDRPYYNFAYCVTTASTYLCTPLKRLFLVFRSFSTSSQFAKNKFFDKLRPETKSFGSFDFCADDLKIIRFLFFYIIKENNLYCVAGEIKNAVLNNVANLYAVKLCLKEALSNNLAILIVCGVADTHIVFS